MSVFSFILLLIILDVPVEQKRIDPIILSFNTSEPVVTVDAPLNLSKALQKISTLIIVVQMSNY